MNLQGLIVCRNLLDDKIFDGAADEFEIASLLVERAERLGLSGNLYRAYLIYLLAHEPNLISTTLETNGGKIGESLREIFIHDVEILLPILRGELWSNLKILNLYKPTVKNSDEAFNELLKCLENLFDAEISFDVLNSYLDEFKTKKINSLILGCTHFPLFKNQIQKILPSVEIVDPAEILALHTKEYLSKNKILNGNKKPKIIFYTSGDKKKFRIIANEVLNFNYPSEIFVHKILK